jgi:hypothetical protein
MNNSKQNNKILIYCNLISNRLSYITNILLNKTLGLDFQITNDKNFFINADSPKFSYTTENNFNNCYYLSSHSILYETNIHPIDIEVFDLNDYPAFFKLGTSSFFPFDIFAASFYLLSRYEEYLPFNHDKFGRFTAKESFAFKNGFLEIPLINIWANLFCDRLCEIFPQLKPQKTRFKFISTIDVDNAWAHLNKGFIRTTLSFGRLLFLFQLRDIVEKFKVLFFKKVDPYNNYDFIDEVHKNYGIELIYFILFSDYSRYDKSIAPKNLEFRRLIKEISQKYEIGTHPSFLSNIKPGNLKLDKEQLESLVMKPIIKSRQHYLYLKFPNTYVNLIKLGILQDFSMGYSSHIGFRASFCLPYNFFNLSTNEETSLEIIPFALMDVCFKDYQKIKPENVLIQIKKIISSIKNVNGLFVSVWHNETLINNNQHTNWRTVFEQMLLETKK